MSQGVPFCDLAAMTRDVRADVERAWDRLLSSNGFIGGDAVEDFEQAWASYCGCRTRSAWAAGPMPCC
jgi:dTDP-4-amino-4,6-dideoxygalactose transaminase